MIGFDWIKSIDFCNIKPSIAILLKSYSVGPVVVIICSGIALDYGITSELIGETPSAACSTIVLSTATFIAGVLLGCMCAAILALMHRQAMRRSIIASSVAIVFSAICSVCFHIYYENIKISAVDHYSDSEGIGGRTYIIFPVDEEIEWHGHEVSSWSRYQAKDVFEYIVDNPKYKKKSEMSCLKLKYISACRMFFASIFFSLVLSLLVMLIRQMEVDAGDGGK
jgi:hypothetical protein